ncbi:MAG: FAD-binding protein [Deltaproteobacteria bacterium]|nr:FAD-binding protein [Deltaproteobacteria bacterium]MBW2050423.1 FAD-binding protein [Deltaproteobacteria bacterium]MBW2111913.1 FAD-binding protein [Deltaproteobacteria bacterium]MBW2353656.1 FAD-binding protein [Deltaproteobacteria bacterium]
MAVQSIINELREIVGPDNVLTSDMDLALYSYDASLEKGRPDVVVLPGSTEEVSKIMAMAHREKVPILGRGSGTNLTGGTIPVKGGIVVHFSRMNRILEIDIPNRTVTVEPGVITLDLQTEVLKKGFVYQPDPASQKVSTIGGNIAENSGGPHCLKYGVTSNHVQGLELVLDDGTVIRTGGKSWDNPGYDIKGLFVGCEGTLGLVTKAILKLEKAPEAVKTMLAIYDTIEDGANTVSAIIAEGIIPATLEMMDNRVMRAVEETIKVGYPLDAAAVLIIELDGMPEGMEENAVKIMEICRRNNVREVKLAKDDAERAMLWAGRKGAFGSVGQVRPSYLCCDGTVPRSKLPEVLAKVIEIGERYHLPIGNVFHAGDGNLHPLIMFDERDPEEKGRVLRAATEILRACADAGGTISGEHGIGLEKLRETSFIFCENDLEFERRLKRAFDPDNIINPGKMIPEPVCVQ